MRRERAEGFTLIELSIVLVIIGLIVGGILVGQDLIKAAEVRAQISQIEKYNSAVNTFRAKFNAIPGDMGVATANQFGFTVGVLCDGTAGKRDGNGLIEGNAAGNVTQVLGETAFFWVDLGSPAAGKIIDGQFPGANGLNFSCNTGSGITTVLTPGNTFVYNYFPAAKIGRGNIVYVYSYSGFNWFGISTPTTFGGCCTTNSTGQLFSAPIIPVLQAYNLDNKIDDGLPTTGVVQAAYVNNVPLNSPVFSPSAATDSTTSCYNTTSNAYSVSSFANYGAGGNCALSFRFQ